ncbi:MAG TPA: ABC transporter permease, partial [bacterium]|nr:ABC transporter permease [bacterium]
MDKIIRLLTANIKETLRDKATLFWTILFPIIFIAIFGIVYGNEEYPPMDVGLAVEETNDAVQPLIDGLKEVEMFAIEEGSRDDLEQKLHDGKLVAVIIVEKGFARDFLRQEAQVIVKYDPANRTSSEVVLSALSAVIDGMNQFITQTKDPISLKPESVQTEGTRMIEWLVPGILGMSIMQLGLFASAIVPVTCVYTVNEWYAVEQK